VTADQIKNALGEFLDIWPASIAADVGQGNRLTLNVPLTAETE